MNNSSSAPDVTVDHTLAQQDYALIHSGIVSLLEDARRASARSVNAIMTASYWEIGRRIVEHDQGGRLRADYGTDLIKRLGDDLSKRFGRGLGWRNLAQMRVFYLAWAMDEILQTVSAKSWDIQALSRHFPLPWSAYVRLLSVKNIHARAFYEREALRCGWSVRQLDRQINTQFYERTALSTNKVSQLMKGEIPESADHISPDQAIKDPFVLEFLDLKDEYSESDLEEALIQKLADFLLELGDDFAFVGRQRRLRLDGNWLRIDLLFFHRRLKSLLIVDLKVGRFSHADAGQMHMYLNYAREHWMKPGENPPVELVLCTHKGSAEARYSLEGLSNTIMTAEYRTILPDEKLLVEELRKASEALELRAQLVFNSAQSGS